MLVKIKHKTKPNKSSKFHSFLHPKSHLFFFFLEGTATVNGLWFILPELVNIHMRTFMQFLKLFMCHDVCLWDLILTCLGSFNIHKPTLFKKT